MMTDDEHGGGYIWCGWAGRGLCVAVSYATIADMICAVE